MITPTKKGKVRKDLKMRWFCIKHECLPKEHEEYLEIIKNNFKALYYGIGEGGEKIKK